MAYADYNNKMNIYMKNRWTKRRAAAIEKLGGVCKFCGAKDFLEFDHIDKTTKTMTIARAASRNEKFFWEEVSKCQLLCTPCHLEKTAADFRKEHRIG